MPVLLVTQLRQDAQKDDMCCLQLLAVPWSYMFLEAVTAALRSAA